MFQGHYGPAGIIKLFFSDISYAWLIISTQVIDIAFFILAYSCKLVCQMNINECPYPIVCSEYATANVEWMRANKPLPSNTHAEFSHSLTGAFALTLPFTLLYILFNGRGKRSFVSLYCILFLGVLSHWLLDVLVHRPDMALFPPLTKMLIGYGTWNNWTNLENCYLELGCVFLGVLALVFTQLTKFKKSKFSFWISTLIFLVIAIILNWVAYFGEDASKKADSVVDGSVISPDQAPLILFTYIVAFVISHFMNPSEGEQKKDVKSQ